MNLKGLIGITILGLALILSACEANEGAKNAAHENASHTETTVSDESKEQGKIYDKDGNVIEGLLASKKDENKTKNGVSEQDTPYIDDFEEEPPFKFLPKNGKIVKVASTKVNQIFISKTHDFYNKTLGYKNDKSINVEKQTSKVKNIISKIESLQTEAIDFKRASALAQIYLKNNDKKALIYLHRIFHDLDIAINGFEAKKVWGFTYTFQKEDTDIIGRYIENNDGV
ncbi:hypothetical protein [Virgibacillus doumboii]|uniref:hypothetical protein n=1 Tax=Virgibacillus doumboii TaxID=2697503 RepID=UPI0013E0475B|nr:hypothetical protein [Virgibacillus doumboii]